MNQPLKGEEAIAIGQDASIVFRVLAPEKVELASNAAAAATSLSVKPLRDALSSGDKLLFGENTVVTLSAGASAGAITVAVDAIPGTLQSGEKGQKIRDLTSVTLEFEVVENGGDATPVIANGDVTITPATQTGVDRGKVTVFIADTVTATLEAKSYLYSLWNRTANNYRPVAYGTFEARELGFL